MHLAREIVAKEFDLSAILAAEAETELATEVEGWLAQAEGTDVEEDAALGAERYGGEMRARIRDRERRLGQIRAARAEFEAEPQAATTARPDPGTGHCSGRGTPADGSAPWHPAPGAPDHAAQAFCFFESNTRSASILGVVAAGGIGLQIAERIKVRHWDEMAFIILPMVVTVAVIDWVCGKLRPRLIDEAANRVR